MKSCSKLSSHFFVLCQFYSAGSETIMINSLVYIDHCWMKFSNAYQGIDIKCSGTEFCPALAAFKTQLGRLFQYLHFVCSAQGSKRSDNTSTAFHKELELSQTAQRPYPVMLHPQHVRLRTVWPFICILGRCLLAKVY